MEWISVYILIGIIVNVITMFNKDIWEYWIEFGAVGFLFQLAISAIAFPIILFVLAKEKLSKE